MNNIQNMIDMLRQGKTGSEILEILDSMMRPETNDKQPTLETIDF